MEILSTLSSHSDRYNVSIKSALQSFAEQKKKTKEYSLAVQLFLGGLFMFQQKKITNLLADVWTNYYFYPPVWTTA